MFEKILKYRPLDSACIIASAHTKIMHVREKRANDIFGRCESPVREKIGIKEKKKKSESVTLIISQVEEPSFSSELQQLRES
jgi:hypothetical protein